MSEIVDMTIAEMGRLFRSRSLSPVEVVAALVDRMEKLNPALHAFTSWDAESALDDARAAEKEMGKGEWRGPLHGVPCAVKSNIDVAGQSSHCHSEIRKTHIAKNDSHVVDRLKKNGCIILGRNSMHEFAVSVPTRDLPWPPALNPWNPNKHPGGSSSGGGAAVAAGMVPGAVGTDTGGSVRNPATSCGIVGMKPTYGLVSRTGVFPLSFSLDHVGPLTRTVEDNAILLGGMAGYDRADPSSAADAPTPFWSGSSDIWGLRVGVLEQFYSNEPSVDAEMVDAMNKGIQVLSELGANVSQAHTAPLSTWASCGRVIQQAEQYVVHEKWLKERPADYCASSRAKLPSGAFISAGSYIKAQQLRQKLRVDFAELMNRFDVLVTLSSFNLPCDIDDAEKLKATYERQARMPFNVTGTPAIAIPTGMSRSGMPLGMQICGRAFDEMTVYRVAHAFSQATNISFGVRS